MQEFDVYVNTRLVEADLIVSKIPYRSGISVSNRIVLESILMDLVLCRFVALNNGLSIVSRIDSALLRAYAALGSNVNIAIDAEFCAKRFANLEFCGIKISPEDLFATICRFMRADNIVCLDSSDAEIAISSVINRIEGGFSISVVCEGDIKADYEAVNQELCITSNNLDGTKIAHGDVQGAETQINSGVNATIGRYRKLHEIDSHALSAIDDMALSDLDFVEL